ncbi:MAG: phosphoribosylanthranilate isomerase [Sphaerochaeta sp.]|jgi:phosphoribosylanthranilate isomerase|uniref:phosphoribosylanthranilate isomerase n=1 Tax=Sphaerochaeta sp. TaxID=1972642 RepID=UPI003D0F2689
MTKIKLCGMQREEHIEWANEAGCDYIGFVFAPSRRQISRAVAADLRKRVSSSISVVGVFVDESIEHIARIADEGTIDLIQLHGSEDEVYLQTLRSVCSLPIIKAVCNPHTTVVESSTADYFLLDGAKGGSGKVFDWRQASGYDKPIFLAGGLHAGNLEKAIRTVCPYAVDMSSGLEEHGEKQRHLMLQATAIAHTL